MLSSAVPSRAETAIRLRVCALENASALNWLGLNWLGLN
jgi:hypothetical protein